MRRTAPIMPQMAPTGAGHLNGGSCQHHTPHQHHHSRFSSLGWLVALVVMMGYVSTNFKVHGGISSTGAVSKLQGGVREVERQTIRALAGAHYKVLTAINAQTGHKAPVLTNSLRGLLDGEEVAGLSPAAAALDDDVTTTTSTSTSSTGTGSKRDTAVATTGASGEEDGDGDEKGRKRCLGIVDTHWTRVTCNGADTPDAQGGEADVKWCREMHQRHGVQVGRSWGSLGGRDREQWEGRGCNGAISLGRKQACDEIEGYGFVESWRGAAEVVMGQSITGAHPNPNPSLSLSPPDNENAKEAGTQGEEQEQGGSTVVCGVNFAAQQACVMENVMVDFSKALPSGGSRDTHSGFVVLDGEWTGQPPNFPHGITTATDALSGCELWEEGSSIIMAHDDIFNYGHSLADFWSVFVMGQLWQLDWHDTRLINMDGIHGNGPAGNHNHILVSGQPDFLGPFFTLYRDWCGRGVDKAIDYGNKKVCFRKLMFQPEPGVAHIWSDFSRLNLCSLKGPSWLYQEYNRHVRRQLWGGDDKAPPRPLKPQVTFLVRKMKIGGAGTTAMTGSSRIVSNEEALLWALGEIEGVEVVAQDFSLLSFRQQMHTIHNTSVLLGFHGAGMAHLLSLPVGEVGCCGVVEMTVEGFHQLHQFGNQARHLGIPFFRYESRDQSKSTSQGTEVDVEAIKRLVQQAIHALPT